MEVKSIIKDSLITVLILVACTVLCHFLSRVFDDNNPFASSVFILAVALISLATSGYVYGIASSFLSVFCVNYVFTYPFFEFNLSISGYSMTFSVMLLVSILISTLTTRIKRQESIKAVAEMEKARANLLRSISHDLRTPLASIFGASSSLLADNSLSEGDRRVLLREINKNSQWMVRVMENILSVTKFSGGVELKKSDEVVEEIVGSAIVKFRKTNPDIRISVDKPESILLAPMDAVLIEQVLINLLDNAVNHGHCTAIMVKIADDGYISRLSVSDNGVGIAAEDFTHLFDGRSAVSGSSDTHRNMGIGLSVCRSIIKAHGGDLYAENNPTGGAKFTFSLPLEKED